MQIVRAGGAIEECGNTSSTFFLSELEFGRFTVVFGTSQETRGEGFELYTLCYKPAEQFLPGIRRQYTLLCKCIVTLCLSCVPTV